MSVQELELYELRAENERLKGELRLVTSPAESIGAVVTALRARVAELERQAWRLEDLVMDASELMTLGIRPARVFTEWRDRARAALAGKQPQEGD